MNKQTNKNKKRLTFLHFHRNALITSLFSVKAFDLRASLSWLAYRTSRRNHHWIGEFLKRSFGQYNIFNYRLHFIHFYFFKIQSVSFRKPYMWFNVVYYFSFYLWNPSNRSSSLFLETGRWQRFKWKLSKVFFFDRRGKFYSTHWHWSR